MNYTLRKKLLSTKEIMQLLPLSQENAQKILRDREEIKDILSGQDKRLLLIIGPCSAWPNEAVLEYANRLSQLNKKVAHNIKLVMRVYIQKPRTTKGWTGPINQPDPFSLPDIERGVLYTRKMMLDVIKIGLPIADEALFPHNAREFLDLLSWVCIGARSSEDQEHRIFASGLNCATGMKNPTHGDLAVAVNSVIAAQHSHVASLDDYEIQTHGNPYAHIVLRGSNKAPNYSNVHLAEIAKLLGQNSIKNPAIIIDASHDNCLINGKKDCRLQKNVIFDVLANVSKDPALKNLVKGFMVESFLLEGNQKIDEEHPEQINRNGLSITDPCLGWDETEAMLLELSKLQR